MATRAALEELCARLVERGINAVTDVRAAVPPCVLAALPSGTPGTLCAAELDVALYALAPGPWSVTAWDALDLLTDAVLNEFDEWTTFDYNRSYPLDDVTVPAVEIHLTYRMNLP